MKNAFSGFTYLWRSVDIRRKITISLILLVIFRLAANIPVPGINAEALKALLASSSGGNFFAFLDLLSGGTISNFSLLAMGVYPYITAQIILQLLTPIFPALQRKMEEDPREGRKWQEKWTIYLAVPMALLSALGQINLFNSQYAQLAGASGQVVPFGFTSALWLPSLVVLISMVGGTMFAIWLGELISEYGIRGQGLSLIIFAGIVAQIPANFGLIAGGSGTRLDPADRHSGDHARRHLCHRLCSAGPPLCAGDVPGQAGGEPHVHAGQRHAAPDGEPGWHDPAHFCECHPAIPGDYCQLLCQFEN